jgi:hypothetical protein
MIADYNDKLATRMFRDSASCTSMSLAVGPLGIFVLY